MSAPAGSMPCSGIVIAIDGPTASGKGTLAKRIAARYGLAYLDSGALYRAVAYQLLEAGQDPANEAAAVAAARTLDRASIPDVALRNDRIGNAASVVAAMAPVRAALLEWQRRFAAVPPGQAPGAVLDGRDIGTVVCPKAQVKLFVTAEVETRARRRFLELRGLGHEVSLEAVLADLTARDARDMNRAVAPLKPAADAHLLDTSNLDIEAAFVAACTIIDRALS